MLRASARRADMKSKNGWKGVFCGVMLALGLVSVSHAEDAPSGALTRQQRDAVCTKCHDESETKPILSIYQTPHGAIGDSRTPACQDCHGESQNHLSGKTEGGHRLPPDRVFGSKHSPAGYTPVSPQAQSEACLVCHKAGLRMHWPGSQHQTNDVACTSCHVVHSPTDPVRIKEEQPTVCFKCHREKRAEINKISAHPIAVGKMACS
ncbi:cytochrome c3 family protein, partial [Paraburkholderia sp.]|uniref:cytochrome c3 family protein n=1 Tax=Paraburkholderia sp. TaxID=1926495 RepID=UPI0025D0E989